FAGFEPMPAGLAGRKHRLYLDMGFNFQGNSGVTYGGFLLRLDGQYNRLAENAFVFRYFAQYYARQGIVLFDPGAYRKNDLNDPKLEACLQNLRSGSDQADSLVSGFLKCSDGANRIVNAYDSDQNEVFFLQLLLAVNLGHAVGVGP